MRRIIYITVLSLLLVGCGGGGKSSTATKATQKTTQKGYFIDSKVQGLKYDCQGVSGYTDSDGAFYFNNGADCKFYANKVLIKEAKNMFNGIYLVESDKKVVEFLLTLDEDGDFNNGIQIPRDAENYIPETLPSGDEIDTLQSKLQKNIGSYNGYAPSEEEVLAHIQKTLKEHRPTAIAKTYEVLWNNPLNIKLEGKDKQTSKLKYRVTKKPQHGKLVGKAPNVKYIPDSDFVGKDSFSFVVNDYSLDSKEATITLDVTKEPSTIFVNKKGMVVDLGEVGVHKKIYMQDPSLSLYLVFTNYSEDTATIDISPKNPVVKKDDKNLKLAKLVESKRAVSSLKDSIEQFNNNPSFSSTSSSEDEDNSVLEVDSQKLYKTGDSSTFYLTRDTSESTDATLVLEKSVNTANGVKNLKIWVSKDSLEGKGCKKEYCVNKSSVKELADKFLKDGDANDIYDLVTNVYGKEWDSDAHDIYDVLIEDNQEINILLSDLNGNNAYQNEIVGFYYAKDNFKKSMYKGSNERLMFYIDSNLFAKNDPYWKNEIYITLAHEFQHMINFYQKNFTYGSGSETWLNEMLSEATEDLVAVNLGLVGPRQIEANDPTAAKEGIVKGRYPYFNRYGINLSLNTWKYNIYDYSKVNAFGAFLTRKYGAEVLHEIMHNSFRGYEAVEYGVSNVVGYDVKIEEILQEWAAAVVLSDEYSLKNSVYNRNDYIKSSYNDIEYKVGSINLFNYSPKPNIATSVKSVKPLANYYYKVDTTDKELIDLKVSSNEDNVKVLLIAK